MTRGRVRVVLAALAAVLLLAPATAGAAHAAKYTNTPGSALRDCGAGHFPLKGHYTIKVLQAAQKRLDSGTLQYTNCADVLNTTIHSLELAARRNNGGGNNPSGGRVTRSTHSAAGSANNNLIKRRLRALKSQGGSPVLLPATGQTVTPGTVTVRSASFFSNLPTPLLIVLAALLATVLAVGARAINTLVRARRTH